MGSGWAALVWEPLGEQLLITQIYDHQSNLAQGGGKDVAQVPDQLRKMAEFLAARLESAMAETWNAG